MKIKVDYEKLQRVADNFVNATELSISILAPDYTLMTNAKFSRPSYCMEIQKCPGGNEKCRCSDLSMIEQCAKQRKQVSHICRAGLIDTVVPILNGKNIMAYILIGRVKQNKSFDEIEDMVSWTDNTDKLRTYYEDIRYYSESQVKSLSELTLMLTSFIISNKIIEYDFDDFTEKAISYINDNLKQKITIDSLCRYLNVSKNTLYEQFHTAFGCTVNKYIIGERIENAKKLLKNTKIPVKDVAEEVGIINHTYFCKLFKAKTGISPLIYRKINSIQP